MANETHHKTSEDNPTRLRIIVSALAVIYVMTFLSGFCRTQDTIFSITSSFSFYS